MRSSHFQPQGTNLDYTDEDAHFGVWSTSSLVLIGNAGACSTGPSFRCSSFNMRAENFNNNSGHCSKFGLTIKGSHTRPVQDIMLWRIRAAALWGYVASDLPTFNNVRLADFSVGLAWGGLGGDPVAHTVRMQTLSITNSLFLGRSTTNPSCFEQVGILLPIAGSAGFSISPSTCGPLGGHWFKGIYGMEHPSGSNPTIAFETRVRSTTFAQFYDNCGLSFVMRTLMRGGMDSADAVPPLFFDDITIDQTSRDRLAYLPPPKRDWIQPTKCVVMDCDGPKHVIIHDLDGTLMGLGRDGSIIARAEFMHQTRADSSEWTWYNIPTKMLYDPAPLNDLGDPGHDMSEYMNYSGGAQSFTYDRRRLDPVVARMEGAKRRRMEERRRRAAVSAQGGVKVEPEFSTRQITEHRKLVASAVDSDWRMRMVFYEGDERAFYQGLDGTTCDPTDAIFDPSCRTPRKTHAEVAYAGNANSGVDCANGGACGYGVYREGCEYVQLWNAWKCTNESVIPARLIIESMDADHTSRALTPVGLASGGYVDLLNGGWDHQTAKSCGGYGCLTRLMTFHATVGIFRGYDLAFTGTNPQTLRLMLPSGAGHQRMGNETKVIISIFYSNPQKLEVHYRNEVLPPLDGWFASYNFSMRKPTIESPCGANAYASWENKLYVTLCGGIDEALTIVTVDQVVLSMDIEVTVEEFFDSHFLVRNMASLFGIPASRMKVPTIVAGSAVVSMEIEATPPCEGVVCGAHGHCFEGECICDGGYQTPRGGCAGGGECTCSQMICPADCEMCDVNVTDAAHANCTTCAPPLPLLLDGRCVRECPTSLFADPSGLCLPCDPSCASCRGPGVTDCTSCEVIGVKSHLQDGACAAVCSAGYYADDHPLVRNCHRCHPNCATCSGPRASQCLSCKPNACSNSSCPKTLKPVSAVGPEPEGVY